MSDESYAHALKVWNTFKIKTFQSYHDLYLKTDVLLLADVMETFRKEALRGFSLDPLHYRTLPALALDAALKTTNVKLDRPNCRDWHLENA